MTSEIELDIEKQYITNATVSSYLSIIAQKMKNDNFVPDMVVGLSRGGLPPGIMTVSYTHLTLPTILLV